MTLLLVFALMTVGLFALFLGGTVVLQGYLYQQPADRAPVRALAGALLLGGFLTLWAVIDKNSPGRYDTFFNFSGYTTTEFTEFEAMRWPLEAGKPKAGGPAEEVVKFKRTAGGKGANFVEEGTNKAFELASQKHMTFAIRVKGPGDAAPVRYNVTIDEDPRTKSKVYAKEQRFVEEKGSRYVEALQLGTLFVPSTRTVLLSLLLNFALFVMWLVVAWPVLRFALGHALGIAAVGGLTTMLVFMPLLFKYNRVPAPPPAAAQAAEAEHPLRMTDVLSRCRVVLVRPHYAGNLGATARAMRNFGLSDLVLVAPYTTANDLDARRMATHGMAVLDAARVVPDLGDALADCVFSLATSSLTAGLFRSGTIGTAAEKMPELLAAATAGPVAVVFGPEPTGLSNEEIGRCHGLVNIPVDPQFGSLNLAQAVAICCYELRKAWSKAVNDARGQPEVPDRVVAPGADQERMFNHLEEALTAVGYLYGHKADPLMHALRQLIGRALPSPMEVKLLHGLARQVLWAAGQMKKDEGEKPGAASQAGRDNSNEPRPEGSG